MDIIRKERLWTGQYTLVLLTNLAAFMINFVLLVSIPLYLGSLGASNTAIGLSTGLYSAAALLFRPLIGHILDRRGRLRLMQAGLIPIILGVVFSNFTESVTLQLIIRIVEGIGFSIVSTTGATIVSDLVPESRFTEGLGYNGMVVTFMNAIGPLVGISIINALGYDALFLILIPVSALPMAVTLFLKESGKPGGGSTEKMEWKHLFSIEKGAVPASALMVFSAVSYGGIITFLAPFGMERGLENMQFFFVLFPATVILSRFLTGRLVDRYGFGPVVIPSLILGSISLVIISTAHTTVSFSIAAILYGLGYGSLIPAFTALAVRNSPPDRRGAANATFYISLDIGIGGGASALGFISSFMGLESIFLLSSFFMFLSLLLYFAFGRKGRFGE